MHAMRRNPALSAFLAQTPEHEGGMPMTAPPMTPQGDPLANPRGTPAPSMPTMKMGPPGNPFETAMVAMAQLLSGVGRPRGLTKYLRS